MFQTAFLYWLIQRRQEFVRIHNAIRVKLIFDGMHQNEFGLRTYTGQPMFFDDAYAVFGGNPSKSVPTYGPYVKIFPLPNANSAPASNTTSLSLSPKWLPLSANAPLPWKPAFPAYKLSASDI